MNRYPALLLLCCVLLLSGLIVLGVGCQRSSGTPGQTAGTDQQQQQSAAQNAAVLEEIRRTGQSVEALAEEVKRQQSLQAQKAGDPPAVRDLAVARWMLNEAQKAVQAKNAEAATGAIRGLKRVAAGLAAGLPGAVVAQHADRALYQISQQQAIGSKQFVDASLELSAASDAAVNGRPAELVPEVLKDLDNAKAAVAKSDASTAIQALTEILTKATGHPSLLALVKVQAAVRGAEEALYRQAWPVVAAELTEADDQLAQLGEMVAPSASPEKPKASEATDTQPATQAQPATGATSQAAPQGAPAANAGAAPATAPAATGQPPAGQQPAATPPAATGQAPASATPGAATPGAAAPKTR